MKFANLTLTKYIIFSTALIACFLTAASVQSQSLNPPVFDAPWRGFDTGTSGNGFAPVSFAVGDLDGDADADALVGNSFFGSPGIAVLKNRGDGTFNIPVRSALPFGETIGEVALSDFDRDGDLDAFATIRGSNDELAKIAVWRNAGDGSFTVARVEFPTGQAPVGIWLADFTGDTFPDVVTANYGYLGSGNSVSLLRHNGQTGAAAAFLAPVNYAAGAAPLRLAAADVNGDNRLDLAVGHIRADNPATPVPISILLNGGSGDFAAPFDYASAPGARLFTAAVAFGDLDNDGDADLIGGGLYTNGSVDNGAITIRRNNGSGVFGSAEIYQFGNYVPHPKEITTGDINGDGFADIIAGVPSGRSTEGFETLLSNGAGGFQTPRYYEASQQTFDVAAFDVDRDGDLDVATLANSSAAVTIHENPGSGVFRIPTRYSVASLSDAVESADIDNDGDIDIVVNGEVNIASNDAIVTILKNNGDGTFASALNYSPLRNFGDMKLRDINGDGFVDLIFAPDGGFPAFHIGTALNNGNGTFAPTVVHQLFACGEGTIDALDLDSDGDRDIVLTEEQSCIGGAPVRIFILRNDGNQNFFQMPNLNPPGLPHGLALADATGDGKADIITAVSGSMEVFPSNGNLTFGAPILSTSEPYKFTTADFNGDGKLDLGMIMPQPSFGTDTIATALGNGNGTFQAVRTQTGSSVLESLRISNDLDAADFNSDGKTDLLTYNYASNDVSLFLNAGDGSLLPQQRYGIGNTPILGTAADFNRDGKIDAAAAIGLPPSGLQDAVVVLQNLAPNARRTMFDFDGDGKADQAVFRPSDRVWYLLNSQNGSSAAQFGLATDKITPADYDGDGKTDIAVFRDGVWYWLNSSNGRFNAYQFGIASDIPVPADFTGDGRAELAVYRNGVWWTLDLTNNQYQAIQFGIASDKPVPADFDGDGKTDFAVYRDGIWYMLRSSQGFATVQFGIASDKLSVGDYDGDSKADQAVYRNGVWYILGSTQGSYAVQFGLSNDIPAAADYDGDGKTDIAVYRDGIWYLLRSQQGYSAVQFGIANDTPIPAAFVR